MPRLGSIPLPLPCPASIYPKAGTSHSYTEQTQETSLIPQYWRSSLPGTQTSFPWPSSHSGLFSAPWMHSCPSLCEPWALKSSVIIHCEINPGIGKPASPPSPIAPPPPARPSPHPVPWSADPLLMPAYGESHNEVQTSTGLRRPHYPGGKKCGRNREEGEGQRLMISRNKAEKLASAAPLPPWVVRAGQKQSG